MSGYAIVIEGERGSYSAYCPELPGCVAAAASREEIERLMREAIDLHLEALRASGDAIPAPSAGVAFVEV